MQCFLPFYDDLGTPPTWRPHSWKKKGCYPCSGAGWVQCTDLGKRPFTLSHPFSSSSWGFARIGRSYLATIEGRSQVLTAVSLKGRMHTFAVRGSDSRLAPVAKPFWSRGGIDALPLLPPPPLRGTGHATFQWLTRPTPHSGKYTAPCLSAFWRFRSQVQWSSSSCHIMPKCEPLVIVCGKAVQLTISGPNFVLRDLLLT